MRFLASLIAIYALSASACLAQISDHVVRIGILTDDTGTFSALSGPGGVIAARMAVEDFGGRAAGAPVEIVTADHANRPDIGSTIARTWYDRDGVDVIMDVPNSSVALAVQSVARERGKLVIYSASGTAELTGKSCMPTSMQWTWDTYSIAASTGHAILAEGKKRWFIVAADYTFGTTMAADLTRIIAAGGGQVIGTTQHPLGTADFSAYLLQAQAAHPDVIALANGGTDTINSVKQFAEFGGAASGASLVGLAVFISDVHSIGVQSAAGLLLTTGFYWDRTDETRAWSRRFFDRHHAMPTMAQAGLYSAVTHYLKAVEAAGTDAPDLVAAKMRAMPVNDVFAQGGRIREDGRMVHDMYLVQVKKPDQVRYPWDYYTILRTIPAQDTVRPLSESQCPLAAK